MGRDPRVLMTTSARNADLWAAAQSPTERGTRQGSGGQVEEGRETFNSQDFTVCRAPCGHRVPQVPTKPSKG